MFDVCNLHSPLYVCTILYYTPLFTFDFLYWYSDELSSSTSIQAAAFSIQTTEGIFHTHN